MVMRSPKELASRAIVRPPAASFGAGLTTANLGVPDLSLALEQHEAYCLALEHCGLTLRRLEPNEQYPDSTFVEDTAIVTGRGAILTRPGAVSRTGEVAGIAKVLTEFYSCSDSILEPGTVDGGDICEAGEHFFIGISERTNEAGAQQLAELLDTFGYTSCFVDIRGLTSILHLKSGLSYLGDDRLAVIDALMDRNRFGGYHLVRVKPGEEYAANCVLINNRVLFASGYPHLERELQQSGYQTIALNMSEFQKMDGGLSCLSLRF